MNPFDRFLKVALLLNMVGWTNKIGAAGLSANDTELACMF